MNKLYGVTVCVNYADFLCHVLPVNKQHFDRLIVVTSENDLATQRLCETVHVECIKSRELNHDFNKGKAINLGLDKIYAAFHKEIRKDDWVVHMDADIFLPHRTREILNSLDLDPSHLYGVDRLMCPSYDEWQNFISNPMPQHENEIFVHANAFSFGVRIAKLLETMWHPIGFFQLFNPHGVGFRRYPEEHSVADRSDMIFAQNWERRHRTLIPEIVAIHLESESTDMGINWNGRKSKPFGPHVPHPPVICPDPFPYSRGDRDEDDEDMKIDG